MQENENYKKNVHAISSVDESAYQWILSAKEDPAIFYEKDLWLIAEDGKRIFYYKEEPSIESETKNIQSLKLGPGDMTCLIGVGLGYTVKAILQNMKRGHYIVAIEPNAHILGLALQHFDFSENIISGNLSFLPPDSDLIQYRLSQLIGGGYVYGDLKIIPDPRSVTLFPNYSNVALTVQLAFTDVTASLSGETKVAKSFLNNEIENLVRSFLSPGVEYLKEIFGKRPILVIGSGPSLGQSIPWIKQLRDRMVLLAFSASLRLLLDNDVIPHILISSDKNEASVQTIKHTKHAHEIPLIFSSRLHPHFLEEYTGPIYAVPDSGPFYSWIGSDLKKDIELPSGVSVACFALEVAEYFESDPIVLTGLDLAFQEYSHAEGHPFRQKISLEDKRFFTIEGLRGTSVKSNSVLFNIKGLIENKIKLMDKAVINASAEGAKIIGTGETPLEEFLKLEAQKFSFSDLRSAYPAEIKSVDIQPIKMKLSTLLKDLEDGLSSCRKGIKTSKRLRNAIKSSSEGEQELREKTNNYSLQVEKLLSEYPFLKLYMGEILYETKIANAKIAEEDEPNKKKDMEVDKNLNALKAFAHGLKEMIKIIHPAYENLEKLQRAVNHLENNRGASGISSLGAYFFENYLYDKALCLTEEAISKKPDHWPSLILLGNIEVEKGRFEKAKKWMNKAMASREYKAIAKQRLRDIDKIIQEIQKDRENAEKDGDRLLLKLIEKEIELAVTGS